MAQFTTIAAAALMRLIGTPAAPLIVDVRIDEDAEAQPVVIPTARRVPHRDAAEMLSEGAGRHVVVVCHGGLKLSHGVAALLRTAGWRAEALDGGMMGWIAEGLPVISRAALPASCPGSLWVTRHRPKIDRIACPWLIRRFIDPEARFLFVPKRDVAGVADRFGAIAFDLPGAEWTHRGAHCTFDHLLEGFGLATPALDRLARVIRGADTGRHDLAPECAGLLALSVGLSRAHADDLAQLDAGMALYDALYRWARDGQEETHGWEEASA
jgi:rhodanese-related sulfurtransferase